MYAHASSRRARLFRVALLAALSLTSAHACRETVETTDAADGGPDAQPADDARAEPDDASPPDAATVETSDDGATSDAQVGDAGPLPTLSCLKAFGGPGDQTGGAPAVDKDGSIAFASTFFGTLDFGDGGVTSVNDGGSISEYLVKFDAQCKLLWARWGGTTCGNDCLQLGSVAFTAAGDLVMWGNGGHRKWFDGATGATLRSDQVGAGATHTSFVIAPDGSLFASGYLMLPGVDFGGGPLAPGNDALFVAKFDAAGNHLWSKAFGSKAGGVVAGITTNGDVVVRGNYRGTMDLGGGPLPPANNVSRGFVARLSGVDGSHVWTRGWQTTRLGTRGGVHRPTDVTVVGGALNDDTDFGNGVSLSGDGGSTYVLALNPDGGAAWASPTPRVHDLAVRPDGEIDVLGDDLSRLHSDGGLAWNAPLSTGLTRNGSTGIAAGPNGETVVTGGFGNPPPATRTVTFGGVTLTSHNDGLDDIFLLRVK
jgi:hypothetical protein